MEKRGRSIIIDGERFVAPTLADEIQKAASREEEQKVFGKVSKGILARFTKGDNPLLMSVKSVIEKGGYSINIRTEFKPFLETLEGSPDFFVGSIKDEVKNGKQKGIHYHHFIRARNLDLALETLGNNHELDKFKEAKVRVLGDFPDVKPPKTTRLMRGIDCLRVGDVCRELGIPFSTGARVKPDELLTGTTVPIFTDNDGRYFIEEEARNRFAEFVVQRYKDIKPKRKR